MVALGLFGAIRPLQTQSKNPFMSGVKAESYLCVDCNRGVCWEALGQRTQELWDD